jgi:precorrin isomerase
MLHLIVDFIYQSIPIGNVPTTLLKVRRFYNIFEQHGIKVKGVIGAPHGYQTLGSIVLKRETAQDEICTYSRGGGVVA